MAHSCPVCQLGTLAKYPCLKPGLWQPFSLTGGKERAGVEGVSTGGEWDKDPAREVSRPCSGQTQERCVCMSSGNKAGLTAESAPHSKTQAAFRVPATGSPSIEHTLTEHLLCVEALGRDLDQLPLP